MRKAFGWVLAVVLVAGCGGEASEASKSPAPSSVATPTRAVATAPVTLAKKNFAAEVNKAMRGARTFAVTSTTIDDEGADSIRSEVRLTGTRADLHAETDEIEVIRVAGVLYALAPDLTGSASKPWARIDPDSDDSQMVLTAALAKLVVSQALPHVLVNAAPYTTKFVPGPTNGSDWTPYRMVIDTKRAVAAGALGGYISAEDAKDLPKGLDVTFELDNLNRPNKISLTVKIDGVSTAVVARYDGYGEPVDVAQPPKAKLG